MADCSKLEKLITKIAINLMSRDNVNDLTDVVREMQVYFPEDIRREFVVEAIVNATTREGKERTALQNKIRKLKQEAKAESEPHQERTLAKEIELLEKKLAKHDILMEKRFDKATNEEIALLKHEKKAIQDKLDEARRKSRPFQKEKLKAEIKKLEEKLETNDILIKEKTGTATDAEIESLKAKQKELQEDLKAARAGSVAFNVQKINRQITKLQEKLTYRDFATREEIKSPYDEEVLKLEFERNRIKAIVDEQTFQLRPRTHAQRVAEVFDFARLMQTTGEFSLVLRQGGPFALAHPVKTVEFVTEMLHAFADESYSAKLNHQILNRHNAPIAARAGLHMAPIDGVVGLSEMEEAFMSHWATRVPVVRNFTRAGATFLNLIRSYHFDVQYDSLLNKDSATEEQVEIIANGINVFTGRGNLYAAEKHAVLMNRVFYAPKYVSSRFELLTGQPIIYNWRAHAPEARKLIAIEYARYAVGLASVYALAVMAGGELDWNPLSSDFGKIRFGKTRIDPLSGLSQVTVILARTITGAKTTGGGKTVATRPFWTLAEDKKVPYGSDNTFDVVARFVRGKFSPLFATPVDLATGTDVIGQEVTVLGELRDLTIPLTWNDIIDVMVEQGIPKGTAMSITAMFGMGMITYKDRNKKSNIKITEADLYKSGD